MKKPILQKRAIELRKEGFSYSEILKKVPVARSTLFRWVKAVNLSKPQKQRLSQKRIDAMKKGWRVVHENRLSKCNKIKEKSFKDVSKILVNPLWMAGIMLYWGEGSKQKEGTNICQAVVFNNSDNKMLKLYLKWLKVILQISDSDIKKEIYIHETGNVDKALDYWSKELACSRGDFKVYFKRNITRKIRYDNDKYNGLIRITVKRSTDLNRRIAGWTEGICKYWGVD